MYFWLIALGVLILDQSTKWLVQQNMTLGQTIPIIKEIFHLTYVHNYGAAFGMMPNKTTFFIVVTLLVMVLVAVFYRRIPKEKKALRMGLALQFGGAIGNLIDRVAYGHVVDFFDFRVWPVFNIADMAIVAGVTLLAWEMVVNDGKDEGKGTKKEIKKEEQVEAVSGGETP